MWNGNIHVYEGVPFFDRVVTVCGYSEKNNPYLAILHTQNIPKVLSNYHIFLVI